ncbi:hypothetical protein BDU57DRAFT_526993 [Ampelomyces quisqualis]|uniref:Uncharacterized protein n=1 Tax=Ampelomyces quisqualis TaxID=50730 RepID=A0A6A5QT65_AMPQU|nr:hypothetical protein BDU57DRAFT_526993 [Ampelomyces quisqualis]
MEAQCNNQSLEENMSASAPESDESASRAHSCVTVRIHDELDVETNVEHRPDGSIMVDIRRRRHDPQPRRALPQVSPRTPIRHRGSHRPSTFGPFGPFGSLRIANLQRPVNVQHAPLGTLSRSGRIWNFGEVAELDEANDLNPATPPPTYQESLVMPRYEENFNQGQARLASPPSPVRHINRANFPILRWIDSSENSTANEAQVSSSEQRDHGSDDSTLVSPQSDTFPNRPSSSPPSSPQQNSISFSGQADIPDEETSLDNTGQLETS